MIYVEKFCKFLGFNQALKHTLIWFYYFSATNTTVGYITFTNDNVFPCEIIDHEHVSVAQKIFTYCARNRLKLITGSTMRIE